MKLLFKILAGILLFVIICLGVCVHALNPSF
jgi:hypothetical protein